MVNGKKKPKRAVSALFIFKFNLKNRIANFKKMDGINLFFKIAGLLLATVGVVIRWLTYKKK